MKITKELIDRLPNDDSISVKEYDSIINIIEDRVNIIWNFIISKSDRMIKWWAFSNDVEYGDGNGSSGGKFDPERDQEFINIIGDFTRLNNPYYEYNDGFPTYFLWKDYEQEVLKHIEQTNKQLILDKKEKQNKRNQKKQYNEKLIASIKSKLTIEELKFLKIK